MRILITGSAGKIGTTLVRGLKDRHQLRGFDANPTPDLSDATVGDISDYATVEAAVEGMDAVMHLVNVPGGNGITPVRA